MTTTARTHTSGDAGWYTTKGEPLYEIPKAKGDGMRAPTLADAKKRGDLLPRVTTILRLLDKPQLTDWKIEQAVLAVLTTPRLPGEADDAFVYRVLHVEEVQNQERDTARDKGIAIHEALQNYFLGLDVAEEMKPWIMPAALEIAKRGELVCAEKILVGPGYAGRTDLIQEAPDAFLISDFKGTKKLPDKGSWLEHRLQLSAYAKAFVTLMDKGDPVPPEMKPIRTSNVYVSSIEPGKFVIWDNPPWVLDYENGFALLVKLWQHISQYTPKQ